MARTKTVMNIKRKELIMRLRKDFLKRLKWTCNERNPLRSYAYEKFLLEEMKKVDKEVTGKLVSKWIKAHAWMLEPNALPKGIRGHASRTNSSRRELTDHTYSQPQPREPDENDDFVRIVRPANVTAPLAVHTRNSAGKSNPRGLAARSMPVLERQVPIPDNPPRPPTLPPKKRFPLIAHLVGIPQVNEGEGSREERVEVQAGVVNMQPEAPSVNLQPVQPPGAPAGASAEPGNLPATQENDRNAGLVVPIRIVGSFRFPEAVNRIIPIRVGQAHHTVNDQLARDETGCVRGDVGQAEGQAAGVDPVNEVSHVHSGLNQATGQPPQIYAPRTSPVSAVGADEAMETDQLDETPLQNNPIDYSIQRQPFIQDQYSQNHHLQVQDNQQPMDYQQRLDYHRGEFQQQFQQRFEYQSRMETQDVHQPVNYTQPANRMSARPSNLDTGNFITVRECLFQLIDEVSRMFQNITIGQQGIFHMENQDYRRSNGFQNNGPEIPSQGTSRRTPTFPTSTSCIRSIMNTVTSEFTKDGMWSGYQRRYATLMGLRLIVTKFCINLLNVDPMIALIDKCARKLKKQEYTLMIPVSTRAIMKKIYLSNIKGERVQVQEVKQHRNPDHFMDTN